jgi:hypothetical protein
MSIPTPVISHPIRSGPGAALPAIWEGRAKMPLPIIDPTTSAVSAAMVRPALEAARRVSVVGVVVITSLLENLTVLSCHQFEAP